jgi:hypothetical protein
MAGVLIIERIADPLPGGRGQLVQTTWIDGEQVPELSFPVGSPAPMATVREFEGTRRWTS